jgi:hypothetical protein
MTSAEFLDRATKLVVANFNSHRNPLRTEQIDVESLQIVWYAKILTGWKVIFMSTKASNLIWEVTYSGLKDELYLDVYSKINNIKVSLAEDYS